MIIIFKNRFILFCGFSLILMFLLSGCNGDNNMEYTIELDGNPTTGYTWSYLISDDKMLEVVRDEYVQNESEDGMVGVPGKQIYAFKGKVPGEVTVHLTYKRNWEETSEGQIEYDYILTVNDDLSITLKEKKLF